MQRIPLPSGLPQNFTTQAAKEAGVSRNRLQARDLHPVFHGVRSTVDCSQLLDRLRALMTVLPETAAVSHQTSASLMGIPMPANSSTYLHVTLPRDAHRVRRPGVVAHRADRPYLYRYGIRLVSPAATGSDLGCYLGLSDLVIAGDDILHRDLATLEALRDVAAAHSPGRGSRVRREALDLLRPGSASPMETTARLRFALWGLPEPELNAAIIHRGGWIATVDFLWRGDLTRTAQLEDAGYRVIVITRRDLGAGDAELYSRLVRHLGR